MQDILASYEQRIEGVQSIFDTTRLVLADFQDGAAEAGQEHSLLHTQLRETLARNEHLRNKDYERMLQPIIEPRRARENETRKLLNQFLAEQQRLAAALKEHFSQIRLQLAQGDPRKILAQLQAVKQLLKEQEQKKEELVERLKEVQEERRELLGMVKQLLTKGNALRIRDFKEILGRIQQQRQEQIDGKLSRRLGVRQMLSEFKQQRVKENKGHAECGMRSAECGVRNATLGLAGPAGAQVAMAGRPAGDRRMQEALEALPWGNNRQGGEQTKNMAQEQAG